MNMILEPSSAVPAPSDAFARGAELRRTVPRTAQAEWTPPADRRDPVQILIDQGAQRIASLLPERTARMSKDPFCFLRGAAAIMAADLATTPASGLSLQACGDCHLANFGSYATPEGIPVFDLNDFDETLPAPFEWDLKRLATSLTVAGRVASLSGPASRKLARQAARSYREHLASLALLPPLAAWSQRIDLAGALHDIDDAKLRSRMEKRLRKVLESGEEHFGLIERTDGLWRIKSQSPQPDNVDSLLADARDAFASYCATLQEERRVLMARYRLNDVAFKVVGIGSVGTFCAIGLFVAADGAPLLLQIKQAQISVLAPYAGASAYLNQGERVVVGQRMLQAASDVFLSFTQPLINGRDFYVRRLKDSRLANIGAMLEGALPFYAELCGRTLARAHARAGDAAAIAGYVGEGKVFEEAIADFAAAYADQTERDWDIFKAAIAAGRIEAASK